MATGCGIQVCHLWGDRSRKALIEIPMQNQMELSSRQYFGRLFTPADAAEMQVSWPVHPVESGLTGHIEMR